MTDWDPDLSPHPSEHCVLTTGLTHAAGKSKAPSECQSNCSSLPERASLTYTLLIPHYLRASTPYRPTTSEVGRPLIYGVSFTADQTTEWTSVYHPYW